MGKTLDAILLCAFTFLCAVLALTVTGLDLRLSAIAALIMAGCTFVIVSERSERKRRKRVRKAQADKQIKSLVYAGAKSAHEAVFSLLKARYPVEAGEFSGGHMNFVHAQYEDARLFVIQKLRATPDDVLAAWRAHGENAPVKALVVAVPGKSEPELRVIAYRLKNPNVVLIDRAMLRRLARIRGINETPSASVRKTHPFKALRGFISRGRALRYLLYAFLLSAYYLLTGHAVYLFAGLTLCVFAAYSLFSAPEPERLM